MADHVGTEKCASGSPAETLHKMACIRRSNEPVYIMWAERDTDVY